MLNILIQKINKVIKIYKNTKDGRKNIDISANFRQH